MKIIIAGLGNFGTVLAGRLTDMGHEVIGIDKDSERIDTLKDRLSATIRLDMTNIGAVTSLPINDVDVIIVTIGDDFASSVQAVAILKQLGARRIVARSMTSLHTGVLQTLGVERVVLPEKDSAELLSQSLSLSDFISSYRVDTEHYVVQFIVPKTLVGKSVSETDLESRFGLQVITTKRVRQVKNLLGLVHSERAVVGVPTPDTILQEGDILVVYGKLKDYDNFTRSLR